MRHPSRTLVPALLVVLALGACATQPSASVAARSPSPTDEPSPTETASPSPTDSESEPPEDGPTVEVILADSNFDPEELSVAAGTEVVFVNGDDYGHTVTEGRDGVAVDDPFVDEEIDQESIPVVFDEPGTYELTCRIHPTMNMTITVEE